MEPAAVPDPLRERLGDEGTLGLLRLLDASGREWSERVLTAAVDRFERRLTQEIAGLRQEMREGLTSLRQAISDGDSSLRQAISDSRFELLKWALVFGLVQLGAFGSLVALVLRGLGR